MNIEKLSLAYKQIHLIRLAIVFIVINLVIFALLVLPNQSRIATLQSNYASARTQAMSEQKQNQELKTRIANLRKAQKDLDEIYTKWLVPKEKGVTDIRLELESLAQSMQVRRQDVSLRYQAMPDFKLQQFTVSVPVEGTYRNIRQFINKLERSRHFLILERVDLTVPSKRPADTLNLDFKLSTYLVDEELVEDEI
jgi:Tfp pilus assembly protein PilO